MKSLGDLSFYFSEFRYLRCFEGDWNVLDSYNRGVLRDEGDLLNYYLSVGTDEPSCVVFMANDDCCDKMWGFKLTTLLGGMPPIDLTAVKAPSRFTLPASCL